MIRKAVVDPMPVRHIMKIKRMNRKTSLAFRNKPPSLPEIFDNEGKNKADVPEIIHIIDP